MDGAHDMGGVALSGPVEPEPNEPVFHAEWERRTFALTLAMGMPGGWNLDMSRFAREDRPPEEYLGMSYYQIWLAGLQRLMLERGLIASDEIQAARSLHPAKPVAKILTPRARPALALAIACVQKISIPPPIPACPATCAVISAASIGCSAVMFFPTATPPAPAKIRNGCIR